ncbi:hypothetical protein AVEN_47624-1 [Araneus ventricosus]|uniref:Uncharacterized protein n=1 Tax=Araneus ventricosus TaxID=182803 RepID=A0A4Y2W0T0_ARAVE|nr:hypothetical protein AVEN_47624-1 [Araneus ventricosus]
MDLVPNLIQIYNSDHKTICETHASCSFNLSWNDYYRRKSRFPFKEFRPKFGTKLLFWCEDHTPNFIHLARSALVLSSSMTDRTPPHVPVLAIIAVPSPVGWTWDDRKTDFLSRSEMLRFIKISK